MTVSYSQYAYADTRGSGSYQLAYVLHPATLWKEFGPIHVKVELPKGIACRPRLPLSRDQKETAADDQRRRARRPALRPTKIYDVSTLTEPEREERRVVRRHRQDRRGTRCSRGQSEDL